jgi:hypothetical protein
MKRLAVFGFAFIISMGVLSICRPTIAVAQASAATAVVGICIFLENDCATSDSTAAVTSVRISVNSAGVWTATCLGTTTVKPA